MSIQTQNFLEAVQRISLGAAVSLFAVGSVFTALVFSVAYGLDLIGW
jgi:hypothetical protein